MIKLYSFGPGFGVVDPSPFVLKVDAYMRIASIEYEYFPDVGNLKKSPKGKLPFIVDGETMVADSEFIISYLQEKFQIKLDSNLSDEQKSISYLMGKSLDENLYWCLVYSRWAKDDTWIHVKKAFFGKMPFPLNFVVPPIARIGVISALQKQGLGRHTDEEIKTITQLTFKSLSEVLGKKTYFFGESPCTFDATAFGFLSQFISVSLNNQFNDLAREYGNLVDYCNNIKDKYY
ncbi:MAG: glutathione S-transferase family protein [Methylococcaceae bacterium]|nr:glutathione S-transferase family protein [Methylococcaceae bacterium]